MTAKNMDLFIEQGATFELEFTWQDSITASDGTTTSEPKDLTEATARMQIRVGYGKDIIVEATTEDGRITLGGASGTVKIVLSAETTDLAPVYIDAAGKEKFRKKAKYDLEVVGSDGRIDRVLQGNVAFSPNITRSP